MIQTLNELCVKYSFKYDIIGNYIRIFSMRDTWYIINKHYSPYEKIKLLHANNYGGAGTHKQKKKNDFNNIYQIFTYIDKHDKKELMRHDKVCRIAEKLKMLYAK